MATLKARLDLTPEDALRDFRVKGEQLSWDYTEVWRDANAHSFTVAKTTTLDVLRTIRAEVDKAIGTGQTFADFKRTLRPRLQDMGWWGRKEVLDGDSGELTTAQLGSNRRLRTIFQTNVQTAYMGGRYKRLLADVESRPYWRYVAVMDGRTRPEHAALNGKVYRWDDPIWAVIWPPNGWGCRCRVVALTEIEFRQLGLPLEDGSEAIVQLQVPVGREGKLVDVQGVRYIDEQGKPKVFRPDPGWDYNPGTAWAQHDTQAFVSTTRAPSTLPDWRAADRTDIARSDAPRLPDPGLLPASDDPRMQQRLVEQVILGGQVTREVVTPLERMFLRSEFLPGRAELAEGGRWTVAAHVVPALLQPFEVWLVAQADGTYRKRYIALFDGVLGRALVVRENRDGSLFWDVFNTADGQADAVNALRQGTLLYSRPQGG